MEQRAREGSGGSPTPGKRVQVLGFTTPGKKGLGIRVWGTWQMDGLVAAGREGSVAGVAQIEVSTRAALPPHTDDRVHLAAVADDVGVHLLPACFCLAARGCGGGASSCSTRRRAGAAVWGSKGRGEEEVAEHLVSVASPATRESHVNHPPSTSISKRTSTSVSRNWRLQSIRTQAVGSAHLSLVRLSSIRGRISTDASPHRQRKCRHGGLPARSA